MNQEKPLIEFEDKEGRYCTNCLINYTPVEFIFDFGTLHPGIPELNIQAKIRYHTRIRTSPQHAKMIANLLNKQIREFEQKFGEIRLTTESTKPPPSIA